MTRYFNPPDCFIEDKGVLDPLLRLIAEESQETVNQFICSLNELVCSMQLSNDLELLMSSSKILITSSVNATPVVAKKIQSQIVSLL